jgi:hypothetical protein
MRRLTRSTVWAAWLAANVLPSLVVSAIVLAGQRALGIGQTAPIAYGALFVLVAALQSVVWLRWRRQAYGGQEVRARTWVAWTIVGLLFAVVCAVGMLAAFDGAADERILFGVGWVIAGLALGFAQANVLGPPRRVAAWWMLASAMGWACAAVVMEATASVRISTLPIARWIVGGLVVPGNNEIWMFAVTLAVYGVFTGAVMARLTPTHA